MWSVWHCHYIYLSLSDLGDQCQANIDLLEKKQNYSRVVAPRLCFDAQKCLELQAIDYLVFKYFPGLEIIIAKIKYIPGFPGQSGTYMQEPWLLIEYQISLWLYDHFFSRYMQLEVCAMSSCGMAQYKSNDWLKFLISWLCGTMVNLNLETQNISSTIYPFLWGLLLVTGNECNDAQCRPVMVTALAQSSTGASSIVIYHYT